MPNARWTAPWRTAICLLAAVLSLVPAGSQEGAAWAARWISPPDASPLEYGVYHFRRAFDLATKPAAFVVRVSADNRYELYANGERVAAGPARGDLAHWRYDTIDLARHLRAGRNVLAAVVWNYAEHAPGSQVSHSTAFLLHGEGDAAGVADTGDGWKVLRDAAYRPLPVARADLLHQYYVAGPGDRVDGSRYPWGWERPDFDDAAWRPARVAWPAGSRGAADVESPWALVARDIPMMEERPERLVRVRRSSGVRVPDAFPRERAPFEVPARTTARLLLDQTHLTTAYPEITVSGGAGAEISLRYAEALFEPGTTHKRHRDEVEGKEMRGVRDLFVADGGRGRRFRPLWWRAYRYVELTVETADEPLTVEDLSATFTAYPFERKARFDAGSEELDRILEVGWRTARLCAHETYMDCPYYEQLQYVGDTRIQALVSLYTSGDDRLMRHAIDLIDESRTAEGLTFSRAPTRTPQYIPPFSLWWIGMVHDFWRYRDDPELVRRKLPGVRAVLAFFAARERDDGSLGRLPWWNFVDWAEPWRGGVPPGPNPPPSWAPSGAAGSAPDDSSAPIDLQLLLAYTWAADLEESLGSKALGAEYRRAAGRLRTAIQARYWDGARGLYADTPAKREFSQQANALAVLAGMVEGEEARRLMERVLADRSLVQCSVYFRHYLHSALNAAGEGDRYLDQLGVWREMLGRGLTTWAETADPSRSDCHAWGSSPNFELFRTVLGVDSDAPGFRRVVVRPFLGRLRRVSGAIPHPRGEVAVRLELDAGGRLSAEVDLPEGVSGDFVWRGAVRPLTSGRSRLRL